MTRCFTPFVVLLALLAGCNNPKPVQPEPVVIVRHVEPQAPEDSSYVPPQGMSRAEVYDMLEERSRQTQEALKAREQQKQKPPRPRRDRLDIYLGDPFYWHYDPCWSYDYGHCWPRHGHHGVYLRTW